MRQRCGGERATGPSSQGPAPRLPPLAPTPPHPPPSPRAPPLCCGRSPRLCPPQHREAQGLPPQGRSGGACGHDSPPVECALAECIVAGPGHAAAAPGLYLATPILLFLFVKDSSYGQPPRITTAKHCSIRVLWFLSCPRLGHEAARPSEPPNRFTDAPSGPPSKRGWRSAPNVQASVLIHSDI